MKYIRAFFVTSLLIGGFFTMGPTAGVLALPTHLLADSTAANCTPNNNSPACAACSGVGLTDSSGACGDNGTQVNKIIEVGINLFSAVVGLVAVIMIIVAGLKFITSGGDPQAVKSARSTILYAIVGLVIVAVAQLIVHFVFTQATTLSTQ